jgi:hypothetical protein
MFSFAVYIQTLCRLAPSCPFHLPFPSYCDVAQARSYFASTVIVALLVEKFPPVYGLSGSLVTTAWRAIRLRMQKTASRYGG